MDTFKASVVFTALALVCIFIGVFMLIVSYNRKTSAEDDRMAKLQMWASVVFCVCMLGVFVTSILWLCGTFHDEFSSYTRPLEIFFGLGARSLICHEAARLYLSVRVSWRWWDSWLCLSWLCVFTCTTIVLIFLAMFNFLSPRTWPLAVIPFEIEFWLIAYFNMHVWKKLEKPNRIKYSFEVMLWLWHIPAYALLFLLVKTTDMKYGLLICLSACLLLTCISIFIIECLQISWKLKSEDDESSNLRSEEGSIGVGF